MSTTADDKGWPFPAMPGVPLNWHLDADHWIEEMEGGQRRLRVRAWCAGHTAVSGRWETKFGLHAPLWMASKRYFGRVHRPDQHPAPAPSPEPAGGLLPFQARVAEWVSCTFSEEVLQDRMERGHRFLEEALELAQAIGVPRGDVFELTDYVYRRPPGYAHGEVGDVGVCLAALAEAVGVDVGEAAEDALDRCWAHKDRIRAKWLGKPKTGPLPGPSQVEDAPFGPALDAHGPTIPEGRST